jgi:Protein of unknown function (DUF3575)
VVKFTPLKLLPVVNNLQLGYEYALSERVSVGTDIKLVIPRTLAGEDFVVDTLGLESGTFDALRLTGVSLTPQVRFYLGGKDAPAGFYLNPWLRFFRYNIGSEVTWTEQAGNSDIDATITWGGFGGGFSLGWQWIIGDHFVIDWNNGIGILPTRMGVSGTVSGPLEADLQDFIDEVNAGLQDFPLINAEITNTGTGLDAKTGFFTVPTFRSNLSIGVAF